MSSHTDPALKALREIVFERGFMAGISAAADELSSHPELRLRVLRIGLDPSSALSKHDVCTPTGTLNPLHDAESRN